MVDVTMGLDSFEHGTLEIFAADGVTPAKIDGVPVWASSDETVLAVIPSVNGMEFDVRIVAPGGPARITVTGDADLGAAIKTITGVSDYFIVLPPVTPEAEAAIMKVDLHVAPRV